jgi:hypothetical protein
MIALQHGVATWDRWDLIGEDTARVLVLSQRELPEIVCDRNRQARRLGVLKWKNADILDQASESEGPCVIGLRLARSLLVGGADPGRTRTRAAQSTRRRIAAGSWIGPLKLAREVALSRIRLSRSQQALRSQVLWVWAGTGSELIQRAPLWKLPAWSTLAAAVMLW